MNILERFRRKPEREKEAIKKHSWHVAIMVLVITVAGTLGVGYFVEKNLQIRAFDNWGYETIAKMPHSAWLNALVAPVNYNFLPWGNGFTPSFLIVIILAFLGFMLWHDRRMAGWALLSLFLAFLYGNLLYDITSAIIFRARPFTVLPNTLSDAAKAAWISWNSFPSGHARDTAMYATIIAAYLPKLKWVLLIFALFVAFSRVYVGAHYPTDALGGIVVGFLGGTVALMLTREFQLLFTNYRGRAKQELPQ